MAYFCQKKGAAVIGPLIFLGNHSYYDIYSALMRTYIKTGGGRGGIVPLNRFLGGCRGDFALVLTPPSKRKKAPHSMHPNLMYAYADINLKKK